MVSNYYTVISYDFKKYADLFYFEAILQMKPSI